MSTSTENPWEFARPLFDGAPVSFWAVDREKRLVFGNAKFEELMVGEIGASFQPGDKVIEAIRLHQPATAARIDGLLDRALLGEKISGEQGLTPDLRLSLFPVIAEGRVIGVSCLGAEIRPQLKEHRELVQSRVLFAKVFHLAPVAISVTGLEDGIVYDVNEAFTRVSGYARSDVLGRRLADFGIWADVRDRERIMERVRAGEAVVNEELTLRKKSGELGYALASFTAIELAGKLCLLAVSEEITQRKLMEDSLRESEERFRGVFSSSPLAISVTIPETGLIVDANEAFSRMTGFRREELIGHTTRELGLWHHPARRDEVVHNVQTKGRLTDLEVEFRTKTGKRGVALGGFVSTVMNGRRVMVGVAEDVTERLIWEERRADASKMEAIGQLAGGVAHDFNNLLTVILGATELMMSRRLSPRAEQRAMERIHEAGTRATQLTRQLLTFGQKQRTRPERLDPRAELGHLVEMLRRTLGENIRITTAFDPRSTRIFVDRTQFQQVLLELALNARDAMPQGGDLAFRTRLLEPGDPRLREMRPQPHLMLEVEDSGVGMTDDVRSHAFEPFFTTKEQGQGVGLGLSTAYGIVQETGGKIAVESEPGRGTIFRLYFPTVPVAEEREEAPQTH